MASAIRFNIAVATMALLVVACGDDGGSTTTIGELTTKPGATTRTTEPEVTTLALGIPYEGVIEATPAPYPANARYFRVEVPPGANALVFTLTDLEADIDLYVGYGSLDSVQGLDAGSWDWAGQEFGATPEYIEIASPKGGVYYLEVFDYDRAGSTFTLLAITD
jgi:hypothetical protein